ncbi:cobalamin biosynthesis protein [Saccharolobus solfataricus]|uniref:Probable cobalamin biosynthesis protein CobD n=3 Tax=Saccharolobus solfataricus TaxID=2287 RepID=Q97TZ5_SACS2|nr:cobalamin biosynthesis protein [Saccharolobus solfataricus]AAK43329.1 Cobalamin biosynthesis protein B (cbiB) [Saccharolobus solfataricus P2]AKA73346.1 cobalamin biosynthesis protein [Saccharolobus solfataricus]AKA76045.1 cobalamin biosynthesis protein [Saccharolobus solfataricus]AKA78738.1 cobalamin biosynthesis protein [Saccharolobus solfataricus]AZF67814.1 cobalamin biosynthesis protein [Saccharolobus solfataricus]
MLFILALALIWDLTISEPPIYIHPVVWTGKISEILIKPYKGYFYGVILWILSVLPPLLIFVYLPIVAEIPIYLKIIILTFSLKTTFSIKMLYDIVTKGSRLDDQARYYAQQIVRRDLSKSEKGHIASALIESLFESTVDGITSPIFWFLIFGLIGAMLQRLANTMDSMVGYKTPELRKEGWFSAKIDTILNYIPARLTGMIMLIAGLILGLDVKQGWKALREAKMESVNAKYPIAIAAGLLNVSLEKVGHYKVGFGNLPCEDDIEKALKLFKLSLILYFLVISTIYYYLYGISLLTYPYGLIELI